MTAVGPAPVSKEHSISYRKFCLFNKMFLHLLPLVSNSFPDAFASEETAPWGRSYRCETLTCRRVSLGQTDSR